MSIPQGVRIEADSAYTAQSCGSDLFRVWATDEVGFSEALEGYFAGVTVGRSWVLGEGAVQAIWARVRDPCRITQPVSIK